MNIERLVDMANQISLFFDAQGSSEDAAQGISDHLARFWDPRMRTLIIRHVDAGGAGLRDSARAAVVRLATKS